MIQYNLNTHRLMPLTHRDGSLTEPGLQKYMGLVFQAAYRFAGKYPTADLDDLIGEGMMCLCEAARTYNPGLNVRFTTYFVTCLQNHFKTHILSLTPHYYRAGQRQYITEEDITDTAAVMMPLYDRSIDLKRTMSLLSAEAQAVLDILFSCQQELAEMAGSTMPKMIRGALGRFMCRGLGWKYWRVNKAFQEIKLAVSQL